MIRGMTGFGRSQGQAAWGAWVWEARSVNGKSVDLRTNFPPGCEAVDFEARRRVKDRFSRGSFQLQLKIDWTKDAGATAIDTRELARLARLSRHWSRSGSGVQPARFDGLLNLYFGVTPLGYGWIFPHKGYCSVGVLGPTRMNYPQALATVDIVSERLGRRLGEG